MPVEPYYFWCILLMMALLRKLGLDRVNMLDVVGVLGEHVVVNVNLSNSEVL